MEHSPIDIVVPWVDGGDPAWQNARAAYQPDTCSDASDARYREWGLFRYWFRSVEQFAPWVRRVHLVTWGHLPVWLDIAHPKLHIVRHADYIPAEYLPTFSSHVIELNMHRIPDLAEQFLYFNDDVYLNAPTAPEDFFIGGLPVDTAVLGAVSVSDSVSFLPYIQLNMLGHINETFSKRETVRRHRQKWFSPKYGKLALYNAYFLPGKNFTGFRNFHSCIAYRRQTLQTVWQTFPETLDATCRRRFRSREDVNQYLFRYWRLLNGEFVPGKPNSAYLTVGEDDMQTIAAALSGKRQVVCVNDDPSDLSFEAGKAQLTAIFETKFPRPCSFETTPENPENPANPAKTEAADRR